MDGQMDESEEGNYISEEWKGQNKQIHGDSCHPWRTLRLGHGTPHSCCGWAKLGSLTRQHIGSSLGGSVVLRGQLVRIILDLCRDFGDGI